MPLGPLSSSAMAGKGFEHVTVVGVGLLGGSAALAIRAWRPGVRIVGVGRRKASLHKALELNVVDEVHLDPAECAAETDLFILATPVGAFEGLLSRVADRLRPGAMVTDVGSTKATVVRMAERVLGKGGPFVGSHPMAGSERKGVEFARGDLFAGATCILTPTSRTPAEVVDRVEDLWRGLGMRTVRMAPGRHDRALARVSHLPHLLASLLMTLPSKAELGVSATGFRDATRLASGDPEMWRDILLTNRRAILDAIDSFEEDLCCLRDLLEVGDAKEIERFFARAKRRRDETIARVFEERRVALE